MRFVALHIHLILGVKVVITYHVYFIAHKFQGIFTCIS